MLISLTFAKHSYRFRLTAVFGLISLSLFVLCILCGFWQYQRYGYKRTLLHQYEQNSKAAPVSFEELKNKPIDQNEFRLVRVQGTYLNKQTILVQNKMHQGKPGFEVLTPIRIPHESNLLIIDRGWIPDNKDSLAQLKKTILGPQQINGYIKLMNAYQFILGENILKSDNSLSMIQKIDFKDVARLLKAPVFPFVLRLSKDAEYGFVRDWIISSVIPERHLAYTFQWAFFAIVIFVAFVIFSYERTYVK